MSTSADQEKPTIRKPNVLPLSLAALCNDTGSDMLFAFYPLFFVAVLGVEKMTLLGLIESIALLVGMFLRPLTGRLADRAGRRHFIWVGYLSLMASRFTQGLAQAWQHLVPPKVLYEVGRAMRNPPREALLAESVEEHERGYAFGFLKSMDTVGAILGPLLGLLAFWLMSRSGVAVEQCYRYVFSIAALPTAGSIYLILRHTREVREPARPREGEAEEAGDAGQPSAPDQQGDDEALFAPRGLLAFTVASSFFSLWAVTENFLILCAATLLRIRRAAIWPVVILYWFINVSFAPVALLSGRLSDRIGRKPPIVAGLLVLAALTAGFSFVPQVSEPMAGSAFLSRAFVATAVLFLLHGAYQGLVSPSQTAFVADLALPARRAETLGTYSMVTGAAAVAAPLIFGLLWDRFTYRTPFIVSGICVGLSAVMIAAFVPERRR